MKQKDQLLQTPPALPQTEASPDPPQMPVDPAVASVDDRTMGMLLHLLALLTGIIGVLILWLLKKDESRFVDHHGREAVNFQLTVTLIGISLAVFGAISMGLGLILAVPGMIGLGVAAFVMEIMACLAAHRGEWHRYPMTIRFIRG